MSQRSDVYEELREAVKRLGRLKGQVKTLDVIAHLDDLWSHLIKTRAAIVKTLMLRGDIESTKDVDPRDFLSLYLQVHNPKRESRLCEHCCGSVEFGITECPYCGEKVNGQNSQQFLSGVVIDFDLQSKGPDWDIDTDASEILEKNRPDDDIEGLEYIKPITRRDDIIGPKGTVNSSYKRKKDTLNRPTRDLISWVRKREMAKYVPYTVEQLTKLTEPQVLLLVSIFKNKTTMKWKQLVAMTKNEMITFVLSVQGTEPVDVGDPPYGDIPDIEDIIADEDEDNG